MVKLFGDIAPVTAPDDSADDFEPQFECCFLGAPGSCKTTLLSCLEMGFCQLPRGESLTGVTNDPPTTDWPLQEVFDDLECAADPGEQGRFETRLLSSQEKIECDYCVIGDALLFFRIHDCPGSWLDIKQNSPEEFSAVVEMVQRSSVIIVTISAPQLMEADASSQGLLAGNIYYALAKALENDDGRARLILLVPTKCETYMQNAEERDRLQKRVEEEFSATIRLGESPVYRGRLAVAYLPVQTVGNVQFKQFCEGEEVYIKNVKRPFSPRNVDQLTLWLLKYLLRQDRDDSDYKAMEKEVDSLLAQLSTDSISVLCGQELLGL